MENKINEWSAAWERALPYLALIGPGSWLIAALVRAAGISTLEGDLHWVSRPEGTIMTIGVPFFVATFIFMGKRVAERLPRTGIAITTLGVLGVSFLAAISGFRVFVAQFADAGLDTNTMNSAFEAGSVWIIPIAILNVGQFLSWIIAGIAVIRTGIAPKWAGIALILGVPSLITAEAFYFMTELFWPLANVLWLLGIWGLVKSYNIRLN
jgi:hypothetical protein